MNGLCWWPDEPWSLPTDWRPGRSRLVMTWFSRAQPPLSWTRSQSASGRSSDEAHRSGQTDRGGSVVADQGAAGDDRPIGEDRVRELHRQAARPVGEDDLERVGLVVRLDVGGRKPARGGSWSRLAGHDPVLDVGEVEDGRTVGELHGQRRDPMVAAPGRRVFEGDRLADAVRETRERAGAGRPRRSIVGERTAEMEVAERAVVVDAHDVADPAVVEVELASLGRPADRHRSGPRPGTSRNGPAPAVRAGADAGTRGGCPDRSSRSRGRGGRHRDGRSSRATGTTSMSWVAAARSAARRCVTETWRGSSSSIRRPSPVARQLEPADIGVAAVLLRADVRDVLVGRRSTTRRRSARRACGPGTSRAARIPNQRSASRPGQSSSTVPTRGEVRRAPRGARRSRSR